MLVSMGTKDVKTEWTTAAKLAKYLGVDPRTVRGWIAAGELRAGQVQVRHYSDDRPRKTNQGHWRIHESEVAKLLRRLRSGQFRPKVPGGLLLLR